MKILAMPAGAAAKKQFSGVFYNVNENSILTYDGNTVTFVYVTPGQTHGGYLEVSGVITCVYDASNNWQITPAYDMTYTTSYGTSGTLTQGVMSVVNLGSNPNNPQTVTFTPA